MKKITILLITIFATVNYSFGQCLNIYLSTQENVDNFAIDYPGCTTLESLLITGYDITNLDGLNQLTTITGDLLIESQQSFDPVFPDYILTDISGLNNISSVGGRLLLSNVPNLTIDTIFDGLFVAGVIQFNGLTPTVVYGFNTLDYLGLLDIGLTTSTSIYGFGGLFVCDSIHITNNANLVNLSSFGNLSVVNNVLILNNSLLPSLSFLSELTTVTSDINIQSNPLLENLIGLENLTSAGRFNLFSNNNLTSLHGLEGLETVGTELGISSHPLLTNLNELSNIERFYGISGAIGISTNAILSDISGLQNIDANTFNLVVIQDNPNLSYCAISNFCENIALFGAFNFTNANGNAPGCNSEFEIQESCALNTAYIQLNVQADVDNFPTNYPGIAVVGTLSIQGNEITNLNGLNQLTTITGNLNITSNQSRNSISNPDNFNTLLNYPLADVSGLNNITTVAGAVNISNVPNIATTDVLNAMTQAGSVSINGLTPLAIAGFNGLLSTELLEIQSATATSISGFNALTSCDELHLNNNLNLQTINGLASLETVGTQITIASNPVITDLNALSSVGSFYGTSAQIMLSDNANLNNLSGLANIAPNTFTTVVIQNNPNLSNCAITSFCEKIAIDGIDPFSTSANNATGCNSAEEIQSGCANLSIPETSIQKYRLFPNPTNSILNIQTDAKINAVKIIDISGRVTNIKYFDNNVLDVSSLQAGIYFIEISTDNGFIRDKFIKK